MARELAGGESMGRISPTALSVSILSSFMHPSHRAAIRACDFFVQTQLGFAEMPRECSETGVGGIWGKGRHQESGRCLCNSSNEVPAASCRAARFPPPPSHRFPHCAARCPAALLRAGRYLAAGHSPATKEHTALTEQLSLRVYRQDWGAACH